MIAQPKHKTRFLVPVAKHRPVLQQCHPVNYRRQSAHLAACLDVLYHPERPSRSCLFSAYLLRCMPWFSSDKDSGAVPCPVDREADLFLCTHDLVVVTFNFD